MLLPSESPDRTFSIAAICLAVFLSIGIVSVSSCESKVNSMRYEASKADSEFKKIAIEKGYEQDSNGYWVKNND